MNESDRHNDLESEDLSKATERENEGTALLEKKDLSKVCWIRNGMRVLVIAGR